MIHENKTIYKKKNLGGQVVNHCYHLHKQNEMSINKSFTDNIKNLYFIDNY